MLSYNPPFFLILFDLPLVAFDFKRHPGGGDTTAGRVRFNRIKRNKEFKKRKRNIFITYFTPECRRQSPRRRPVLERRHGPQRRRSPAVRRLPPSCRPTASSGRSAWPGDRRVRPADRRPPRPRGGYRGRRSETKNNEILVDRRDKK